MAEESDPISVLDDDEEVAEKSSNENEDDYDDDDDDDDYDDEEPELLATPESKLRSEEAKIRFDFFHRISTELVPLRVHDVLIKGNNKTKQSLIETEIQTLKTATSVQELLDAVAIVSARLLKLDIFDSVKFFINSGPPELPGTSNVIVEVVEAKNLITGDIGVFTKPEARSSSFEGSLQLKNLFGYGDLWDGSLSYGWDQTLQLTAGVYLPRFMRFSKPVMARTSLVTQDWLKLSSYKEQAMGLSLGLVSTKYRDLSYNISWPIFGHGVLSHLKYIFKIDRRNSRIRPTKGFAFVAGSQLGGLFPDYHSLCFIRQEFDLRYALPLGYARAALNFGVGGGVFYPWGTKVMNTPTSLPDRFFLGRPTSLLGFKTRGLGPSPTEFKTEVKTNSENPTAETDFVGGDLTVTAFADLSFDLPLKVLKDSNIHAHVFACAGSLTKLTENTYRDFSFHKYRDSFRTSAGFGLVVPAKLFRMEVNYCYILRQHEHDRAKTGVQFSFSSPL